MKITYDNLRLYLPRRHIPYRSIGLFYAINDKEQIKVLLLSFNPYTKVVMCRTRQNNYVEYHFDNLVMNYNRLVPYSEINLDENYKNLLVELDLPF